MIQLRGVKKIYRAPDGNSVEALSGIDLDIGDGEIFGIIGLSGAGKSTLLRTVNRLEEPSSGKIFIDGREITALDAGGLRLARRKIGMIFQHFNLLASRTVTGNVAFPLELERWKPKDVKDRVAEMLDVVELSDKAGSYPSQLSGGQKQRVAIARALANRPHVLLSDEATSALDPRTTKSILSLLAGINRLMGLTIVVVTHEMNVIREICSRVAIIEAGRIVENGARVPRQAAAHRLRRGCGTAPRGGKARGGAHVRRLGGGSAPDLADDQGHGGRRQHSRRRHRQPLRVARRHPDGAVRRRAAGDRRGDGHDPRP